MTSRVDSVAEQLGIEICAGTIREGTVITAEEVQERTSTSRSVVREALRILVSLGLLRVRRRIGYEVRPAQDWAALSSDVMRWRLAGPAASTLLDELMAVRRQVEPAAAGLAAAAAPTARAGIAAAAAEMWTAAVAGDRDGFVAADGRLHRLILEASGNSIVSALGALLNESLPLRAPDAASISLDEARAHLDLAGAIVRGDQAEAVRTSAAISDRTA